MLRWSEDANTAVFQGIQDLCVSVGRVVTAALDDAAWVGNIYGDSHTTETCTGLLVPDRCQPSKGATGGTNQGRGSTIITPYKKLGPPVLGESIDFSTVLVFDHNRLHASYVACFLEGRQIISHPPSFEGFMTAFPPWRTHLGRPLEPSCALASVAATHIL